MIMESGRYAVFRRAAVVTTEQARILESLGQETRLQPVTSVLPIEERVLGTDHPRSVAAREGLAYWTERAEGRQNTE